MINKKTLALCVGSCVLVVLLGVTCVQVPQNKAIALEEQVYMAKSDIQVQEKRRFDLVYNLADAVMQYDKHESETLKEIVESRGSTGDIENVTTLISAVGENYPDLKSSTNYKQLMNELSTTENLISQFRSNYNMQVKGYNRYVRKFPTKQLLDIDGYEVQAYDYLNYNAPQDAPQKLFSEHE